MTQKRKLTPKQQRFVDEYLIDLNATKAAERVGYSKKTAYFQGQRLLSIVYIQRTIQEAMDNGDCFVFIISGYPACEWGIVIDLIAENRVPVLLVFRGSIELSQNTDLADRVPAVDPPPTIKN